MRDAVFRADQRGAGTGDLRIVQIGDETSARPGGEVEDDVGVLGADAIDDVTVVVDLHGRAAGLGIAHVDMHDGRARFRRAETGVGNLFRRDRQMRGHLRRGLIAGHGACNDDT